MSAVGAVNPVKSSSPKTLERKTVRENMDDDILAQHHFLWVHTAERRVSETGLIVVRVNSNQLLGKERLGPGNSSQEGL